MTYREITVSTDNIFAGVSAGRGIRALVLVAATDVATATLFDNTVQSGNVVAILRSPANDSRVVSLPGDMGLYLSRGLSVTLTGTTPRLYVYYD